MKHFNRSVAIAVFCMGSFFIEVKAQEITVPHYGLDYYLDQARATSPLSKDYQNQLLMVKIDSMRLKAGYRPQVSASSTGLYAPIIHGYGYDEVMTNGQGLDALVSLDYSIIAKGQKKVQVQSLQLQQDSIRYAVKLSELDLQKAITEQYIIAYASQEQATFNKEVYLLLKNEESILKELTRTNAYQQTEYLTFLVTFKQQELQYKQAKGQFRNDLTMLNYMAGINDTSVVRLNEPALEKNTSTPPSESLFSKRFDIDSLMNLNERKNIDYQYKPKASVYLNGGYNSSLTLQPYKNFGSSVGFTVSAPIYDAHQKKMQYNKLELQDKTNTAYRAFFNKQHKQQLDLLQQQLRENEELYGQISDQIKFSKGLIDVDSKLIQTGDVKIADFVLAINNYMSAQQLYRQTVINRLQLINQLNYWNR